MSAAGILTKILSSELVDTVRHHTSCSSWEYTVLDRENFKEPPVKPIATVKRMRAAAGQHRESEPPAHEQMTRETRQGGKRGQVDGVMSDAEHA